MTNYRERASKRFVIISLILCLLHGSIFAFETKVINTADMEIWLTVIQEDSTEEFHVAPQSEKIFSYEIKDPFNIKYNLSWGGSDNTWWGYATAPLIEANTWKPGFASKKNGFNIKMIDECETIGDLFSLLDKYIFDYHFWIRIARGESEYAEWQFKSLVTDEKSNLNHS